MKGTMIHAEDRSIAGRSRRPDHHITDALAERRVPVPRIVLGVVAVIVTACGGAAPTTLPSSLADQGAGAPACGESRADPGWVRSDGTSPDVIPLLVTSAGSLAVGANRFVFSLVEAPNGVVSGPDVHVEAAFYDLARDPDRPTSRTDAHYIDPGPDVLAGMYRANVAFPCAGTWGVRLTADVPDGSTADPARTIVTALVFDVRPVGQGLAIGADAPRSETPTASTLEEAHAISTDDDPDLAMYRWSVADAVRSGMPAAILFATPLFCQTASCAPSLDRVKRIAADYEDRVVFVHVEPYRLRLTSTGLQPVLSEAGQLQPVQAAIDWQLPVEPYLFVVDRDGRVSASFEGLFGDDEVREALEAVSVQPMSSGRPGV